MASVDDKVLEGSVPGTQWEPDRGQRWPERQQSVFPQASSPFLLLKPYHSLVGKLTQQEKANWRPWEFDSLRRVH